MYAEIMSALVSGSNTGALELFAENIKDGFIAVLPVAVPVVAGIAVGFFVIKVFRGLLSA